MNEQDEIRRRIRDRLNKLGLSVNGASRSAGLGQTTLRNFLNGMNDSLTAKTINKLAPVLKVSARWLFSGGELESEEMGKVVELWSRMPLDQRQQAIKILEALTR